MKKIFIIVISYSLISIVLQSCCETRFKVSRTNTIQTIADEINFNESDTITTELIVLMDFTFESVASNFTLMNQALAYQCEELYLNSIDSTRLNFSFNREFIFDGKMITANTDLNQNQEIANLLEDNTSFGSLYISRIIKFKPAFYEKAEIANGPISIFITNYTTDNIIINDTLNVFWAI